MAASGVEIDGRRFTKALAKRLAAMETEAERDVIRLAADIREDVQRRVPVKSGKLRRSVRVTVRKNGRGLLATIRVGAFYGKFIEFGTSEQPPRPFFRPAVHQSVNGFRRTKR